MDINYEIVSKKLSDKTDIKLSPVDYEDWLEGGPNYDKFNKAVKKFLGEEAYTEMDDLARLDSYLLWKLELGPGEAGGIVFKSSIPKDRWGTHRTHCCTDHGCKYGQVDCPVITGEVEQEYPCEVCSDIFVIVEKGKNNPLPFYYFEKYKAEDYLNNFYHEWNVRQELNESIKGFKQRIGAMNIVVKKKFEIITKADLFNRKKSK